MDDDMFLDCSVLGVPLKSLRVLVHRYNLSETTDQENGTELRVTRITVHPNFNLYTLDSDIAIWHLEGGDHLDVQGVVRLDNGVNSKPGRGSMVVGWGALSEGGPASTVLMQVQVHVISQETCRRVLGSGVTETMVCAGGEDGADACQGGNNWIFCSLAIL
jgi:trypsin